MYYLFLKIIFCKALRYVKPPDYLLTQLNLYTEEKFEDEEDMRERSQNLLRRTNQVPDRPRSEFELALEALILLTKQHDNLYPTMIDILRHYGQILEKDIGA